jgi:hypothetical protein
MQKKVKHGANNTLVLFGNILVLEFVFTSFRFYQINNYIAKSPRHCDLPVGTLLLNS